MNEIIDGHLPQEKRPTLLTVVAILSFIGTAYTFMNSIMAFVRGPLSEEQLLESKVQFTKSINEIKGVDGMEVVEGMMREIIHMTEVLNMNHLLNVGSTLAFALLGFAGVFMMFKGKKLGFHVYIIYCFLSSVQIYFFMAPSLLTNTMVILNLVISGIFVLLYGLNLKWMK